MPTFLHPALLWGLPLVGIPVLIHLINLFRHRRVRWAAMEFLLESQRRNRRWVMLRQLILLLLRMAAVATIVLIVARPRLPNRLGAMLGSGKIHHIVLLDDSFSMSDRQGDTTAFDRGKAATARIAAAAANDDAAASFTLLRFSQARQAGGGAHPDWFEELVDADFDDQLEEKLRRIEPSQLDLGPGEALSALSELLGPSKNQPRVIYLVSDFRAKEWSEADDLRKKLKDLSDGSTQLQLIACVDRHDANLAITRLGPLPAIHAAGVPMFFEVTVQNFGPEAARHVSVLLEEDGHPRPAVLIDKIAPGERRSRRFSVNFATAGEHQIAARLNGDAVSTDNTRYDVIEISDTVRVLLIDGDPRTPDARFLSTALSPGGTGRTGITPQIERPGYLGRQPLDRFQTIFLANVDRLGPDAVEAVKSYVTGGGGVCFFLGEQTRSPFFNDMLYDDGRGLFPAPLADPAELFINRLDESPDIEVSDHPMFRVFRARRNNFLREVKVQRYFSLRADWKPITGVSVPARLRNGAPLAIEKKYGDGRVVAFLTTAAPTWNNWSRNPSFVVAMLELNAYLATVGHPSAGNRVGGPLELVLDASRYQPQVRFEFRDGDARRSIDLDAVPMAGNRLRGSLPETLRSGLYLARVQRLDGQPETRQYAFNVAAEEGDLRLVTARQLASQLEGVAYRFHRVDDPRLLDREIAGFDLSHALLVLMLLMLLVEQVVAYTASYHAPAQGGVVS